MVPSTDSNTGGTTPTRPDSAVVGQRAALTMKMRALLISYYRAGRALQESIDPLIKSEYGIDLRDYVVLIAIANGTSYPTDIATKLHLGKHSVTRVLRSLTNAGFIEARADEDDSRRTRLAVSEAGLRAKTAMVESITDLMAPTLTSFEPGRIEELTESLTELTERLMAAVPDRVPAAREPEQPSAGAAARTGARR